MQFLNRAEALLISTARIIPGGHNTSAWEERQRARWGLGDPSWAQGAARGPRLCAPAAAPAEAFNLDFSLLASGAGGKPVQMGVLSVTTPLPPSRSRADVARCSAGPRHAVCEGSPRTVHARPWCPMPLPRSHRGAGRWLLLRGRAGVGWRAQSRACAWLAGGGPVPAAGAPHSAELRAVPRGPRIRLPLGSGVALGPGPRGSPDPGDPR